MLVHTSIIETENPEKRGIRSGNMKGLNDWTAALYATIGWKHLHSVS